MKRIIPVFLALFGTVSWAVAQQTRSLSDMIRTVRVVMNGDVLLPPVGQLGKSRVAISFDRMDHEYTRYIYKVQLCNADWTEATDVFESDFLTGFNGMPIEDYETSFNTTQLYTHYHLTIPNENCRLLLPGNYRLSIYEDGEDEAVAEACFSLFLPKMTVTASVSGNTEIDFNKAHQQITMSVAYGTTTVVDPERELHTVVIQNRRLDNAVVDLPPNIRKNGGAEWTHRRELAFPAGNEFHKFDLLDVHRAGMGIDRTGWYEPFFHAKLYESVPGRNYFDEPDANGAYIVRHSGDEDNDTQSEYVLVHFPFKSERMKGGDIYVCGLWDDGLPSERCRMAYDEASGTYEAVVLLKQGYYNYQYRFFPDGSGVGQTLRTDGDYYETENEYLILVFHRGQGERYDALVGMARLRSLMH